MNAYVMSRLKVTKTYIIASTNLKGIYEISVLCKNMKAGQNKSMDKLFIGH